jgi:23S rRNA A2030 N6-methylase RlmJ
MANRHFGKISEVWKHGALAEVLDEDQPRRFAETHAGSADYPLTPSAERVYGVYRLIGLSADNPTLQGAAYMRVLSGLPLAGDGPQRCPGSPLVAMKILGDRAEHLYFDIDPESVQTITDAAAELNLGPYVRAEVRDGCTGVLDAHFDQQDGCVHIDPFDPLDPGILDGPSPVEVARTLAEQGTQVLYWYGYEEVGDRAWAWDEIAAAVPSAGWWNGDLTYAEPETDSGIVGSGMLVANASGAAIERCEAFGRALELAYHGAMLPSGNSGSIAFVSRPRT